MNMDEAVEKALERYMPRVTVKAGNGLSKAMNQTLRSYDQIPRIILRTVCYLAGMEALFDYSGAVRVHNHDIYHTLMDMHDDWVEEQPRLGQRTMHQVYADRLLEAIDTGDMPAEPKGRGTVEFVRSPLLPFHQFTAAWTIARRIGVIEGRGEIGLSQRMLNDLKQITQTAGQAAS
ncbi:MAG TPA: hypothetical protein VNT01_17315 [Symbiobacteriaceae bacterium]|nr:hypothetical protein [Symbiobacteriaceae bacterium]